MIDRLEIPINKPKFIKLLMFSFLLLTMGIWMVLVSNLSSNIFGIVFLLMGLAGGLTLIKIIDKKPGVVIDNIGIVDNSGLFSFGRILWTDILEVREKIFNTSTPLSKRENTNCILLILKNPEDYIEKSHPLFREFKRNKLINEGTPVIIFTDNLDVNHEYLLEMISENFEKYKL